MESPTKRIKRATAKFVRSEVAKTKHSETLKYALLEAVIGIIGGLVLALGYVNYVVF